MSLWVHPSLTSYERPRSSPLSHHLDSRETPFLGYVGHYGLLAISNCLRIVPNHRRTPLLKRSSPSKNGKRLSLQNPQRPLIRSPYLVIKLCPRRKHSLILTPLGRRVTKQQVWLGISPTIHQGN